MSTTAAQTATCLSCGRVLRSAKSIAKGRGRSCQAKVRRAAQTTDLTQYKQVQVDKAIELIEQGGLVPTSRPTLYLAVSSDGTLHYLVDQAEHSCTCPAGQKGRTCYHLAAADILAAASRKAA